MPDKFAPKLTAKQRDQVSRLTRELMDKIATLLFDTNASSDTTALRAWIGYLVHAVGDGEKDSSVRLPTQRVTAAKKIKRSTKKMPTIADLIALHPFTVELDAQTVRVLNQDLGNCCSDMPPNLWERRQAAIKSLRKK